MGPWELGARQQARQKNKAAGQAEKGDDGFELRFPFGQISDDTQCSRELAAAIVDAGRFSIVAFTSKLVELHSTVGVIGQGPTSRATLDALRDGASWFDGSDSKPEALTNGSIMRMGPIGERLAAGH